MNVRELIEVLSKQDPEAQVLMWVEEMGGSVRRLTTDGDSLYFQTDPYHEDGENYVYLCGR